MLKPIHLHSYHTPMVQHVKQRKAVLIYDPLLADHPLAHSLADGDDVHQP